MGVEDDYYDESDELYDEEEENGDFHVQGRLQAPSALQYTTRELHTLIHEGVIDLSPPYQRGMSLITTLYNAHPVDQDI